MTSPVPEHILRDLIARAKSASDHAYSPYSRFRVGAALLTSTGDIYTGCNVENASYGLTVCAERNAAFAMVAGGGREIVAVVIYTPTAAPTAPCGACRQVINEFGPNARVLCLADGGDRIDAPLSELLPAAFGPHNLSGS
jgi:cytidine deaminase